MQRDGVLRANQVQIVLYTDGNKTDTPDGRRINQEKGQVRLRMTLRISWLWIQTSSEPSKQKAGEVRNCRNVYFTKYFVHRPLNNHTTWTAAITIAHESVLGRSFHTSRVTGRKNEIPQTHHNMLIVFDSDVGDGHMINAIQDLSAAPVS